MEQIGKIALSRPKAVILREKDLKETEYEYLAKEVMKICKKYDVSCILHSFVGAALKLGADKIHLPLHVLRNLKKAEKEYFKEIGASCHSAEDAAEAQKFGASYITAGHVFATDCKKGAAPRGTEFLENVCKSVAVPVYAIGGIDKNNIASVRRAGASGACIMSGFMRCSDVGKYMKELK